MTAEAEAAADFDRRIREITPRPWVTPALLAANLLVFAVMVVSGVSPTEPDSDTLVRWGADFGPLTTSGEPWRAFTCMFVHIGIVHLALNMWALFAVGFTIERLFGSVSFLMIYILAGLTGSVVSLAFNERSVSAGASGAIFGILGALVAFLLARRGAIHWSVSSRLWRHAAPTILYSLAYGFQSSGIDNAAHIGGLLGGFLLGTLLSRPLEPQPSRRLIGRLLAGAAASALLLPVLWHLAPKEYAHYAADREWFGRERQEIETRYDELRQRLLSGDLDERKYLGALETDVIPRLSGIARRLGATPQWIKDGEPEFFEVIQLEAELAETWVAGRRGNDGEKMKKAAGIEARIKELTEKMDAASAPD